ncbi:GATA transcription factor 19-like [Phoenix dactylifera]|uniref:GATA transcription factor 19-like n=1 Tax=Phoenix dactylifera TaxID=42345 RepID=A0A8B7CSD6_PHODC|nr:GATA transcription factor 19-like [Phoenix dactylifera]
MRHQCGQHSGGGISAPCSCGFLCQACAGSGSTSFSILFSGKQSSMDEVFDSGYPIPSSSSVDCTLSLGTPSTRDTDTLKPSPSSNLNQRPSGVSSLCWDILSQSSKQPSMASGGVNGSTNCSNLGADPVLLARRCANCDTTSTPLWRNGPRGPKSLCNACGIRYKKEERRAAASTASPISSVVTAAAEQTGIGYAYERRQQQQQQQQPWSCYGSMVTASKSPTIKTYGDAMDEGEAPYLPWRLNVIPSAQFPVRDVPSLF